MRRSSLTTILYLLLFSMACSCSRSAMDFRAHQHESDDLPLDLEFGPQPHVKAWCFHHISPVELVQKLRKAKSGCIVISDLRPPGWIQHDHVQELIKLVRCQAPCARITPLTANGYDSPTTVSREVLYLIDGYRNANFPSGCGSEDVMLTAEEAESWWQDTGGTPEKLPPPIDETVYWFLREADKKLEAEVRKEGIPVF